MMAVRHSECLANKSHIPGVQQVQRNLCRKLGISSDDTTPIDNVLRDFIAMFQGPLPKHIMAALMAIFDLDDDGANLLDDTLLQHAGEAFADLQPVDKED
jgi:hypothetical protein